MYHSAGRRRYRLYVDESGDHTYKHLHDPSKRYLCLVGVGVEAQHYRLSLQPDLERLKQQHFPHSPDEPVVLHRKDLVNRRGPFSCLQIEERRAAFDADLLSFLRAREFFVIAVVIDKKKHAEVYDEAAFHPYHFCLTMMLERYCGWLHYRGAVGDVMAEQRGGAEDRKLKAAFEALFNEGTLQHRNPDFFSRVLTSSKLKLKPKTANVAGLQVADIIAHPARVDVLRAYGQTALSLGRFGAQIIAILQHKYLRDWKTWRINGYGRKLFPTK